MPKLTRHHPSSVHKNAIPNKPGKTNWVEKTGGLPAFIARVAKHIAGDSHLPPGRAIAAAVSQCRKWAAQGNAEAAAAVAEWERMKAASKAKTARKRGVSLAGPRGRVVELASKRVGRSFQHRENTGYDWRHGYIPLNARTAKQHRKKFNADVAKAGRPAKAEKTVPAARKSAPKPAVKVPEPEEASAPRPMKAPTFNKSFNQLRREQEERKAANPAFKKMLEKMDEEKGLRTEAYEANKKAVYHRHKGTEDTPAGKRAVQRAAELMQKHDDLKREIQDLEEKAEEAEGRTYVPHGTVFHMADGEWEVISSLPAKGGGRLYLLEDENGERRTAPGARVEKFYRQAKGKPEPKTPEPIARKPAVKAPEPETKTAKAPGPVRISGLESRHTPREPSTLPIKPIGGATRAKKGDAVVISETHTSDLGYESTRHRVGKVTAVGPDGTPTAVEYGKGLGPVNVPQRAKVKVAVLAGVDADSAVEAASAGRRGNTSFDSLKEMEQALTGRVRRAGTVRVSRGGPSGGKRPDTRPAAAGTTAGVVSGAKGRAPSLAEVKSVIGEARANGWRVSGNARGFEVIGRGHHLSFIVSDGVVSAQMDGPGGKRRKVPVRKALGIIQATGGVPGVFRKG